MDFAFRAAFSSAGNDTRSSPRCSAWSRASRAVASHNWPCRLSASARALVSSSEIRVCPAWTTSPSATRISLMMPPSRCWIVLRLELGFDGADRNRGALERCKGRPGTEAEDKAADQQVSRPGDAAKPVAQRRRARSRMPRHLPDLDAIERGFHRIIFPFGQSDRERFAGAHGVTGCGEAPMSLSHSRLEAGRADSREPT